MNKIVSFLLTIVFFAGIGGGGYYFITKQTQKELTKLEKEARTIKKTEKEKKDEAFIPASKIEKITVSSRDRVEKESSFYLKTDKPSDSEGKESYSIGDVFELIIMVNANGKIVDGAEFVLNYDPELMEIGELTQGEFFSLYPQKNVDFEKGTVKVIALQSPSENKVLNEEIVVILPITALKEGTVNFDFVKEKTHIAGYGGQDLLKKTSSLTITIR